MSRKVGSIGIETAQQIRNAGVRLIYERGFEAMSLRQLAAAVGLQPGSLYNHIPNKQALLFGIMRDYMDDLISAVDTAIDPAADPVTRLKQFVGFHLRHHIARKADLRIVNLELRSLDPDHLNQVVAMRDNYEARLFAILSDGAKAGVFRFADLRVTLFAILAMLTGVAAWWRADGRLSVDEIVVSHEALVLCAINADVTSS